MAAAALSGRVSSAEAHSEASERAADSPAIVVSPNWSGYVAMGSQSDPISFSSVTGTWTVPTASCTPGSGPSSSTAWVGLGGYTTKYQEEVGTDTNCNSAGQPVYYAWFELVPYIAYKIKEKLLPGDTVTGLVKSLSIALVELQVTDQTQGWTWTRNITFSMQDISTADWIVEAPVTCLSYVCSEANLANFGSVGMTAISATTSAGETGTLTDSNWTVLPIQLVPGTVLVPNLNPEAPGPAETGKASSPAGATPGAVSPDGSSFSITWVPKPTPDV
jgi:hypothetical protein